MTRRPSSSRSAKRKRAPATGNQRELARFLGISEPTLVREIRADPTFPIISRGRPGVPSVFDFAAVAAHRRERIISEAPQRAPTLAERAAAAKASMLELQLAEAQGLLVEREDVTAVLSAAYVRLGKFLDRFSKSVGAELGWSAETVATVRNRLDDGRRAFVRDVAKFADPAEPATVDDNLAAHVSAAA
jgi:hypothetical protein